MPYVCKDCGNKERFQTSMTTYQTVIISGDCEDYREGTILEKKEAGWGDTEIGKDELRCAECQGEPVWEEPIEDEDDQELPLEKTANAEEKVLSETFLENATYWLNATYWFCENCDAEGESGDELLLDSSGNARCPACCSEEIKEGN